MSTHDHLRLEDTDEPAESRPPPPEVTLLTIPEAAKFLRIGDRRPTSWPGDSRRPVGPKDSPASGSGTGSCGYRSTPSGRW